MACGCPKIVHAIKKETATAAEGVKFLSMRNLDFIP